MRYAWHYKRTARPIFFAITTRVLADELTAIPFASSMTINLAYRREDIKHPLDGFGFVVPLVEKRTILACSFSSVKFPGRAPDGQVCCVRSLAEHSSGMSTL